MGEAIRFCLDEHVAHAVARGLASRGVDVLTAASAKMLDATDVEHLDFARRVKEECLDLIGLSFSETPGMISQQSIRRLSSSILTPVYKLGFSVPLLACGIASTYQHLKDEPFDLPILEVLSWIFILLVVYLCLRLKKVTAYSDHLVVSNYATNAHVRYHDIEEIKGCVNGALVAFVRLRLRVPCRYGRSVHFLLRSTGGWIESRPEFQLLEEKCPHLQVRVRSWWQVSVREHHR